MNKTTLYRINTERFAHETVDDEVIVIDMDEGNYFSMRGSAAAVWQLVDQGFSASDIITTIESATGAERENIQSGVDALLEQLVDEQILHEEPAGEEYVPTGLTLQLAAFELPVVEKFTEMQDLLTLDPIHEVDETGWPNRDKDQGKAPLS